MKKTLLLKTMLLLCAFIVGSSSAWAADETASFTVTGLSSVPASFSSSPAGFSMSVAANGGTNPAQNNGSLRLYCKNQMTIVSTDGTTKFKSVTFNMKINASSGKYPLISAPSGSFSPVVTDNKATTTTWTAPEGGVTTITFTFPANGTSVGGNWTFSGVSVGYESSNPSITAADVPIVYDATAGSIAYTINNEPTPVGTLTAAIKDGTTPTIESFALGTATGSAVPFTCAANLTATARTATVTLTYTYDTDKTATKDVTITQAADPNAFNAITDITAPSTAYKVKGTVVATNAKGFVIGDGTGYVYTYLNATPSQSVGDKLSITGTTGTYGHILQFTSSATIAEASTSNYDGTPAVTVLDAEGIAAYNSDYQLSDYVQFEGELVKNSSYYEITVGTGSSTATARISYQTTAQATALDALLNKTVRVKGYFAGFSSSKFTVMLESVEEVIVDAHTLTVSATNGSVEITGKTLVSGQCEVAEGAEVTATATANDGYRFVNWTVTGAGSSVSDATDNPTTFTMGTEDATITANFEAIPTHTVTWSINGTETAEEIMEGEDITFPADPADVSGKTFVGWTETAIAGTTDEKPTFVTSATMGTSDLKYYAVFANVVGTPSTLTKMASDETLSAGDKIVIVAYDDLTDPTDPKYYALYQETQNTSWIGKYEFDGDVETVAADDKNWLTVTASESNWILGDDTNGYLYSSGSNNLIVSTENSTAFALAYSEGYGFTFKSTGDRWLSLRNDADKNKFRLGGNGSSPLGVGYFDIYKYVPGNGSYSDYCTTVNATATIPAGKEWITFCSTANLDFTNAIDGLEGAYTITAHENQATALTATKMTGKVKAGTGLLLRAAEKKTTALAITIPVAATGEEQADNMLKGVTVDTEVQPTAGDYTNLGLSNGEFHPYSAAGTLAAGKAYLQVPTAQMPTGGNNARLYIVLDSEATGIANVDVNANDNFDNAPMYNLAGQRVTKSYKGVVIVNGKKFINK